MPQQAERLLKLPPYVFSVIGDRLRQMQRDGIDVVRLDIGNPDMPPPPEVVEVLYKSARDGGNHGYTGYRGFAGFRDATAEYYKKRFGVDLNPDTEVLPLIGSKEGIVNLSLAYLDKGDIALVPDIGYPSYSMGAMLAGGEIHWLPTRAENNFEPSIDAIPEDVLRRAKLLWVNYPNNPTGATVDLAFYDRMAAFCKQNDILLVSDNPYMDVTFGDYQAPSALQASDTTNVLEFFSFSKSYNMAGWRLGVAVGSAQAIDDLLRVKSNVDSGHFKPIYEAGVRAYQVSQKWIDDRNAVYQHRRDRIMDALASIGLSAEVPRGSLYVWARTEDMPSAEYVERALTEAHVSIAPGAAYGDGGEGFVRISLGTPDERLQTALNRLSTWYQQRR
ncbi:MAG: aminotransferase class I/II-fold pyridoxal phosphate-dependent enzyme [Anaerolineaceae bacterium]|nr:MAG: aminotransferase class I/II-fold pyridoxal phosphate-dependent enzyme [Anaerolineaceae bacterium]